MKAIQKSSYRAKMAIEGAGLGTWDWDVQTGETVYNDRWAEMVGCQPHEVRPDFAFWQRLIHPDDHAGVQCQLKAHLAGETPELRVEFRLLQRDGNWIWVLAHGRVYDRDADGTPLHAAGIQQVITERKEVEEALQLSRDTYKHTVELTTQIP